MRNIFTLILSMLIGFSALATSSIDTIKVGTYESAPFSFKENSEWTGPVHDLWHKMKMSDDYVVEYVEYNHSDIREMLDDVSRGKIDVAVGPITMSAERESTLDFTTPYYSTELGVAHKSKSAGLMSDIYRLLTSNDFYHWLLMLFVLWLVVGIVIWLLESKKNPDFNAKNPIHGIGQSIYYIIVVMTTVGFGDKTAKTVAGRIVTGIWMFVSLVITGIFIGNVSSNFTVNRLSFELNSFSDLRHHKVGSIWGTNAEDYVFANNVNFEERKDTLDELFADMDDGKLDVVIYDAAILEYYCNSRNTNDYDVYTDNYNPQFYSFAVNDKKKSLLENLNARIINSLESGQWSSIKTRYNIK